MMMRNVLGSHIKEPRSQLLIALFCIVLLSLYFRVKSYLGLVEA